MLDKSFAYSITYDEGCAALIDHVLPLHRKYKIPGHVSIVAGEVGRRRNIPGSSYNGMQILNKRQIWSLISEGWGVSSHSYTHVKVTPDNAEKEMGDSKKRLEDILGIPIDVFCIPGNNDAYKIVKNRAKKYGYKAVMTIVDGVNIPGFNWLNLKRVPLHSYYPKPFYSEFDQYKRIQQAEELGAWIIDYCHCPTPDKPIHPNKDCTLKQLELRFEAIASYNTRGDGWIDEPTRILNYLENQWNT